MSTPMVEMHELPTDVAKELATDAHRYRWLRDRAGNAILKQLMREPRSDEWDRLVDFDRLAHAQQHCEQSCK